MKCLRVFFVAVVATSVATVGSIASATVLVNGGFEADAVFGAAPVQVVSGWDLAGGTSAFTASDNLDPVHSGVGSLQLVAGGGFGVPTARQTFAVNPGDVVNLQGYHLTQDALAADATFHLFKIVWADASGTEIDPLTTDAALIGGTVTGANPGVESTPFLNSDSAVGEWLFSEAQGTAPTGAASVILLGGLLVDQSAATVYVDDVVATITPVPEPVSIALLGLAGLTIATMRRRS